MSGLTDRELRALKNRAGKDRKRRAKLKARLRAEGASSELIEQIIEKQRRDDYAARHGVWAGAQETNVFEYDPDNDAGYYPDDSGFKPSPGDPLLRGAARVDGVTAKVVGRRNTITRWQYSRIVAPGPSADEEAIA